MSDVTMRQLLEAGVHFGHQTRFWCPKMSPYIYGHRNKIHIINLEQTLVSFNEAMEYLKQKASKRGTVMFVGTKRQASAIIQEQALRAECPYVYHRWLGGMLTNYRTVRKSIDRLTELEDTLNASEEGSLAKRELLRMEREHFRLNRNLAGIRKMGRIPDVLFVIDIKHDNIAVLEAQKLGIPIVAVVDTNCSPDGIDYVIPGNDDAISAIRLYCTTAADAIISGREAADAMANEFDLVDITDDGDDAIAASLSMHGVTEAQAAVAPTYDDEPPIEEIEPAQVADTQLGQSTQMPETAAEEVTATESAEAVASDEGDAPAQETTGETENDTAESEKSN